MKTQTLLAFFAVFLYSYFAGAQQQGQALIDSLLKELPKHKDDTNKVKLLVDISFNYRLIDPKKALKYGNQSLELATRLKWYRGIGKANNTLGNYYKSSSQYSEALKHYYKALSAFELNGMRREQAIIHMNIGTVYRPLGEYKKALKEYDTALKLATAVDDIQTQAQVLGNQGVIYFETKKYTQQQEVSLKALELFQELGDKNNEAWILSNLGDSYAESKDLERGIDYHEKAIAIYEELNNQAFKATSLLSLGAIRFELAKQSADGSNERIDLLAESLTNLKEAEAILKEMDDIDYLKDVYLNESAVYEFMGDHQAALATYKQHIRLQEKLNTNSTKEKIAALETQREIEVQEREIEIQELKKRTEFLYLIGGILLLLVIIGFTVSNNLRQRKLNVLLSIEKQKSEDLLHNILPDEVASELKSKGSADAQLYDNVTVFFADFVGFTAIAEQMTPKELVAEIDECFREFDAIMVKYGVEKIKTIGDAYMAAGGLPVENKTNAEDVMNAALEVQRFMLDLATRKQAEGKVAFRIRIGIHSGPVVAGIVGVKKFAYDIWGDTVNTASRMESSGEEGKINVSGTTYALTAHLFNYSYRGKISAKNKGEIDMYFVENRK